MKIIDKIAITFQWIAAEITNNVIIVRGVARIFEEMREGM